MHEKRFTVHKTIGMLHDFYVNDNLTDKVVIDQIIHKYEANRLCDKLNELHEELQRLEMENQQYKILTEELKRQNKKLKGRLNDLGVEYY